MPKVIIIGAGPNGLAAGINLIHAGYDVEILEAEQESGQGVTKRPPEATHGVCHSGIYNADGSLKQQYCQDVQEWLKSSPASDDTVMRILRENTVNSGKIIIARTDEQSKKLEAKSKNIKDKSPVIEHEFLETPADILALNEPNLDPATIKSVLRLPDVSAINIKGYTKDLEAEFQRLGGKIKFKHKVTGFSNYEGDVKGTIVQCEEISYSADLVINMAGLGSEQMAMQARKALVASGHPESALGAEPSMRYFRMYGIACESADGVLSKYIIYNAENDAKNPASTIGLHTYLSSPAEDGRWHPIFGYFGEEVTQEDALQRLPYEREVTPEMTQQVQAIFPKVNPANLRFVPLGYRATASVKGVNDFHETILQNPASGFCVVNSYTSDSPGLTASPAIARAIVKSVDKILHPERSRDGVEVRSYQGVLSEQKKGMMAKL